MVSDRADPVLQKLRGDDPLIAVVGATDHPAKYGGIIYRNLKRKGYRVVAVNPYRDSVDGDAAYPMLADLPERPDIIDFVVPPSRTLRVLGEASDLGMRTVWVQPGAESSEVVRFLEEGGFDYVVDACIMVASPPRAGSAPQGIDNR
ncbi:MAG: CoA-binding protein [Actinobacteria bacterium]|nr:MAG: CoA-binding protein [Actinomycetota bacterium]